MGDEDYLFVVAIDFGTTYSGFSFSSREDYRSNPLSQHSKQWYDSFSSFISYKTSTCVLFDPQGEFHSFGFDAEEHYYNLAEKGIHRDWYYFRRFKMWLYEQNDDERLRDQNGKEMDAIKVFSQSILYLKNSFTKQTENTGLDWRPNDIRWVLTVPAIWTETKKSFMRRAAEMAGTLTLLKFNKY
ncbi:heat shock 70 kDa protein 12B-like [Saccostrea cucullata]|uniref:heat shock 70 kDa protein 12B-like n=1 Tax=Saccostrea cuccullata TaxID=36930 RepID=UPI002ED1D575